MNYWFGLVAITAITNKLSDALSIFGLRKTPIALDRDGDEQGGNFCPNSYLALFIQVLCPATFIMVTSVGT
jgi:hypothetical protein